MSAEPVIFGNPDGAHAKMIADSRNAVTGDRLSTMQVQCHRFVLAEFNTHRRFSRNSASSRAIPLRKMLARVRANPAIPLSFPAEQKGMQGGTELCGWRRAAAVRTWLLACRLACALAWVLGKVGVHKSVCNRLIEPFMWHVIVVSSTEWQNFLDQRCSPLAQPEIRAVAEAMRDCLANTEPRVLRPGAWHLPYIGPEDWAALVRLEAPDLREVDRLATHVSAARCARTSYLTQEGKRDVTVDLALYDRLTSANPVHWSPLEHTAAATDAQARHATEGNFVGWTQARHIVATDAS